MIGQKHLTIREAKNEIKKLENELALYLTKKKINFSKTQPGAIQYKDIMISSNNVFDKFSHYMIKDEECDTKILSILDSINAYEKYIIDELKRLAELGENKIKVIILRDDKDYIKKHGKPMDWKLIGKRLGYSEKQCRRIYKEYIEN